MAAIYWTDSLSVKIDSIDSEHKTLIDMINDFYENINKKSNNENVLNLIKGLKNYSIQHFGREEMLMRQYSYPYFEDHKKQHNDFILKVISIEEKIKKGTIIISFEITNFLRDWLKHHIQETDKKYTEFFLMHGLK